MRESEIEKLARKRMESLGGKLYKTVSPGNNGFPDRMGVHPASGPFLMEFKATGRRVGALQREVGEELAALGMRVYLDVNSVLMAYAIIEDEVNQRPRRYDICTGLG